MEIKIGDILVNRETPLSKVYYQINHIDIDSETASYIYLRISSEDCLYTTFSEGKQKIQRLQTFTKLKFASIQEAIDANFKGE